MHLTNKIIMFPLEDNKTLLINSISGAFDVVDEKTKNKIKSMENGSYSINEKDESLISALKTRGYLFDSAEDEDNVLRKYKLMQDKIIEQTEKNNFTICPSMGCNLRCTYCFEPENMHKNMDIMSNAQLNTIFSYIKESIKDKSTNDTTISLFGGEPLLKCNYEIVSKVLSFAKDMNLKVKIITNGTTIDFYKDLLFNYSDIITTQVTLDGGKLVHDKRRISANGKGSFERICAGIDILAELKIPTSVRINVDKENIKTLNELIEFMISKKWTEVNTISPYISPVLDFCYNDTIFKESELFLNTRNIVANSDNPNLVIKTIVSPIIGFLRRFLDNQNKVKPWKMHYCEATSGKSIIFTPNGKLSTCLLIAGKNKSDIGTFDENGVHIDPNLSKAWFERTIFRIPKCQKCKYSLLCGGGCPVAAIEVNNDIDSPVCSDIAKTLEVYINAVKDKLLLSC